MNTKLILLSIFILLCVTVNAQVTTAYSENVKIAEAFTEKKDYANAAKSYSLAFASIDGKAYIHDRYNAACVWALSGNKDSAFNHLFRAARNAKYDNYHHITNDPDLTSLHSDSRWNDLLSIVKSNKEKAEVNYIKPVVAVLDTVHSDDQKYRGDIVQKIQKFGRDSKEVTDQLKLMNRADSINVIKVTKILDEYGWLGPDKVGSAGSLTIFLVIQHAPFEVQLKYLPMMRAAVEKKQAMAGNLALLEDRVALRQGKKQIYGSQLMTDQITGKTVLQPMEDPDNVDKRRASVGLEPLADYLKRFNLEWDLEAFKKEMADIDKNNPKK